MALVSLFAALDDAKKLCVENGASSRIGHIGAGGGCHGVPKYLGRGLQRMGMVQQVRQGLLLLLRICTTYWYKSTHIHLTGIRTFVGDT